MAIADDHEMLTVQIPGRTYWRYRAWCMAQGISMTGHINEVVSRQVALADSNPADKARLRRNAERLQDRARRRQNSRRLP